MTPASSARTAAQRAFFDAALNKAGAPAATAPVARAQPTAAAQAAAPTARPSVTRLRSETVQPAAPEPGRILRPGSLIDIKV